MSISLIIPAYNEESRIAPMLRAALHYFDSREIEYEVIVVDDGSKDSTVLLVEQFVARYPKLRLIKQGANQGKGAAVRAGMLAANNKLLLFSDADGSTPIEEVSRLEVAIAQGADVAIGSRAVTHGGTQVETVLHRRLFGRMFNAAVNLLLLPGLYDTQCGFKLFKNEVAKDLFTLQRSNGFSFDCEILWLARKRGYTIAEIGVNWNNVSGSKVNLIKDSLKMLRDLVTFRVWHHAVSRRDISPG